MSKLQPIVFFIVFLFVTSHSLAEGFRCRNEISDNIQMERNALLGICPTPSQKAIENINIAFKDVGITFNGTFVTLPGKDGTKNMSNPDDAQINDYLNTEAFPLNPKKFVVLTTRRHSSLP
jgi:hypothetical protein